MEKRDNHPLVSVVMATFNEPVEILSKAINSILNQTYKNLELIIADDSTNHLTVQAIDDFARQDKRIRVIRKDKKMGFTLALNTGLASAKGELIARMDGDDISLADRIEKQVEFAYEHPDVDLFGGHINIINENGDIVSKRRYKTTPNAFRRMLLYRNPLAHPTILFRRRIIDAGFYYDDNFKKAEDLEFYLRLFKNGFQLTNMDVFLLNYRVIGDLQKKREHDNWYFNHKARAKNFNWQRPIFSICSWCVSYIYLYVPCKIVSLLYKKENNG